jgi:uncharacterized membrane protein YebE (DUF533 family)
MEEKSRLGRDVYIALAAVGWADGHLDPDEADAIVRTAVEEGLDLEEIAEIEAATQTPIDLGVIERRQLTGEDRLFVYAVACWLVAMDGEVSAAEQQVLDQLATRLAISADLRAAACEAAAEVADMPEGDRPDRYDLAALRWLLGERLRAADTEDAPDDDV